MSAFVDDKMELEIRIQELVGEPTGLVVHSFVEAARGVLAMEEARSCWMDVVVVRKPAWAYKSASVDRRRYVGLEVHRRVWVVDKTDVEKEDRKRWLVVHTMVLGCQNAVGLVRRWTILDGHVGGGVAPALHGVRLVVVRTQRTLGEVRIAGWARHTPSVGLVAEYLAVAEDTCLWPVVRRWHVEFQATAGTVLVDRKTYLVMPHVFQRLLSRM